MYVYKHTDIPIYQDIRIIWIFLKRDIPIIGISLHTDIPISATALEATGVTGACSWILLDWLGLVWAGSGMEARKLGSG